MPLVTALQSVHYPDLPEIPVDRLTITELRAIRQRERAAQILEANRQRELMRCSLCGGFPTDTRCKYPGRCQ